MKRMTILAKLEALQNGMTSYKIDKKYFPKSDEIDGKRFCIASSGANGSINTHTRYMNYDEFNAYLFGYKDAQRKCFGIKQRY